LFTRRQAQATGMAWTTLARMIDTNVVERIAHGVYRFRGSPPFEHLELAAAWLQLAPDTPAWERQAAQGVISHRSAAALFRLGELPASEHHFTLPTRRRTRRDDVILHKSVVGPAEWARTAGGLPVTLPSRTAADLIAAFEDPQAVGHVVADA